MRSRRATPSTPEWLTATARRAAVHPARCANPARTCRSGREWSPARALLHALWNSTRFAWRRRRVDRCPTRQRLTPPAGSRPLRGDDVRNGRLLEDFSACHQALKPLRLGVLDWYLTGEGQLGVPERSPRRACSARARRGAAAARTRSRVPYRVLWPRSRGESVVGVAVAVGIRCRA